MRCQLSPVWLWSEGVPQASPVRYQLGCMIKVPALTLIALAVQAAEASDNGYENNKYFLICRRMIL